MSLFTGLYDHSLPGNSLEKPMFRKTANFGHFGQIRPFPVTESGQNCQKAHLQVKTFHMSLFPGLYDYSLQSYSLEKNRWRTDRRTDRRTDGHPESIGPQPLGLGPKKNDFRKGCAIIGERATIRENMVWVKIDKVFFLIYLSSPNSSKPFSWFFLSVFIVRKINDDTCIFWVKHFLLHKLRQYQRKYFLFYLPHTDAAK